MTKADARSAGLDVAVVVKQLPSTFRGWLHVSGGGVIKLIADRQTGVLVGASAAGPQGAEMLGMLSLAVHSRVALADLRSMIYAFPTFYGAIGESVGAYGRGLASVFDPTYEGFEVLDSVGAAQVVWCNGSPPKRPDGNSVAASSPGRLPGRRSRRKKRRRGQPSQPRDEFKN